MFVLDVFLHTTYVHESMLKTREGKDEEEVSDEDDGADMSGWMNGGMNLNVCG